jgi:hypothetical protein
VTLGARGAIGGEHRCAFGEAGRDLDPRLAASTGLVRDGTAVRVATVAPAVVPALPSASGASAAR